MELLKLKNLVWYFFLDCRMENVYTTIFVSGMDFM